MERHEIRDRAAAFIDQARPKTPVLRGQKQAGAKVAALAVVLLLLAAYAGYDRFMAPAGRITAPANGAVAGRLFEVTGYTRNLPPERRYVWLVVEVPHLGLCWPKRHITTVNAPFSRKIHEQGPGKAVTLALYAVDRALHQDILAWIEDCRRTRSETGFPQLPAGCRLHATTAVIQPDGLSNTT